MAGKRWAEPGELPEGMPASGVAPKEPLLDWSADGPVDCGYAWGPYPPRRNHAMSSVPPRERRERQGHRIGLDRLPAHGEMEWPLGDCECLVGNEAGEEMS